MAATAFRPVRESSATVLKNTSLLYIHCISNEDFVTSVVGIGCVELVCRQVHVSFIDKMNERRVALMPCSVSGSVDSLFHDIRSPALVRVVVSSDLEFYDHKDEREDFMVATLIWELEILPAPATNQVAPIHPIENTEIDHKLPPLDLECDLKCNCFCNAGICLCSFDLRSFDQLGVEEQVEDSLADLLLDNEDFMNAFPQNEECSDEESSESSCSILQSTPVPTPVLCSEYFKIKGSMWEDRYQQAFQVIADKRSKNEELSFRVTAEPGNIQDKNAHRFEILNGTVPMILGYCGVEKLPKLVKAIDNKEIRNIKLGTMRRQWIPMELSFKFEGGLNIVKEGVWDKNDPKNRYNSTIPRLS